MKILHHSLKTLDELDEAKARKKAETERVTVKEITTKSKLILLDSDLAIAIESFNPLDPF
jgi:hypothetical protein